jgi:hypothetical protein
MEGQVQKIVGNSQISIAEVVRFVFWAHGRHYRGGHRVVRSSLRSALRFAWSPASPACYHRLRLLVIGYLCLVIRLWLSWPNNE